MLLCFYIRRRVKGRRQTGDKSWLTAGARVDVGKDASRGLALYRRRVKRARRSENQSSGAQRRVGLTDDGLQLAWCIRPTADAGRDSERRYVCSMFDVSSFMESDGRHTV